MIVPRDGEALRRVGTMLRYWSRMPTPESSFLHSVDWVPHDPVTVQYLSLIHI